MHKRNLTDVIDEDGDVHHVYTLGREATVVVTEKGPEDVTQTLFFGGECLELDGCNSFWSPSPPPFPVDRKKTRKLIQGLQKKTRKLDRFGNMKIIKRFSTEDFLMIFSILHDELTRPELLKFEKLMKKHELIRKFVIDFSDLLGLNGVKVHYDPRSDFDLETYPSFVSEAARFERGEMLLDDFAAHFLAFTKMFRTYPLEEDDRQRSFAVALVGQVLLRRMVVAALKM